MSIELHYTENNLEILILDERLTLWNEPERAHIQNMEQLHAHDCH